MPTLCDFAAAESFQGHSEAAVPWTIPAPLNDDTFQEIRRRLILDCCKWDPQVGDVSTLAPFPLVIRRETWRKLAGWAENLTREAIAAEREVLRKPELLKELGLPAALRKALSCIPMETNERTNCRVFRFDFHWTLQGWQISEANSDVPGGFAEASCFAAAMSQGYPGTTIAGDPAGALSDAIATRLPAKATVALLSAVGYMEDQQVTAYLAQRLAHRGMQPMLARPHDLRWTDGTASVYGAPVDAIVRFVQGEWLPGLGHSLKWRNLVGSRTIVTNPVSALISESKRFPLVWNHLRTVLPHWRELLPETRDPRQADWNHADQWVLKRSFCNTGDAVFSPDWLPARQWRRVLRAAKWRPRDWAAQRRFAPIPAETCLGSMYPCFGVYTVDGMAAGIYGRLAGRPVVDFAAMDVAVLVED